MHLDHLIKTNESYCANVPVLNHHQTDVTINLIHGYFLDSLNSHQGAEADQAEIEEVPRHEGSQERL